MSLAPRFNVPVGQWVELDGTLMRFERRGRDREGSLVFEGVDGVPGNLTDREFLDFQHGQERRLRLLTQAEASERLEEAGRPRVTLEASDPANGDVARRRLDYVRGWERAGRPPRTERVLGGIVQRVFDERRAQGSKPVEVRPRARLNPTEAAGGDTVVKALPVLAALFAASLTVGGARAAELPDAIRAAGVFRLSVNSTYAPSHALIFCSDHSMGAGQSAASAHMPPRSSSRRSCRPRPGGVDLRDIGRSPGAPARPALITTLGS